MLPVLYEPKGTEMHPLTPPRPPLVTPSAEVQAQEVRRVIREMRRSAERLGPCPTSFWLEQAATTAARVLEEWETPQHPSEPSMPGSPA